MADEDKLKFELERLRREYDMEILQIDTKHSLQLQEMHARVERLEQDTNRIRSWTKNQEQQLEALNATALQLEKQAQNSITPTRLRNWLIGLASLISALLVILAALESYNQNQAIKHEEKMWLQQQREYQQLEE